MKVNLREIIHYIDESTLEKAKNEKVQKQESPSKMSKDVEESVDKDRLLFFLLLLKQYL